MRHLGRDEKAIAVANLLGVMGFPRRSVDLGAQYVALVIPLDLDARRVVRFVIGTAIPSGGCGAAQHNVLTVGEAAALRDALSWALDFDGSNAVSTEGPCDVSAGESCRDDRSA